MALIALLSATLLAGCATGGPPTLALDDAEAAIARARAAEAARLAPVELRFAEDKLSRAREASQGRDQRAAGMLAGQAEVDAELALMRAREANARQAADAQAETNTQLRHELLGEGP